jgi:type IV pilus assembly protein PilY1
MSAARLCLALFLFGACLAAGAAPQLTVPHGRLGQNGPGGPSAIWPGGAEPGFVIDTSGDLAHAAGSLQRRALDGAAIAWEASAVLDKTPARNIFTIDPAGATIPFAWASLPLASRALLDQSDGLGELRTAFLRGDRSGEGTLFRKRAGLLGDIVGSTPLIVDGLAVYVGANDGMLHAFSAATGQEQFAYVPAALVRDLPALTSPAYKARPYVDGSPAQGRARLGAVQRTVLASGMGMGARGVFALDITDPPMQALWEFGPVDDPAMGHVREAPLIAKSAAQRWFAVVSSGINNLAPDGAGALFLLALDKPASQKWQRGANYFSIAAAGSYTLAAPALVLDADGGAIRAYAGDLLGNLWRFDLASMTAHRLFSARDAGGAAQPIAHAPKVVHVPGGGYLVLFATGKLIEQSDLLPSSYTDQTLYAIFDAPGAGSELVTSRTQLAARTMSTSAGGYAIKGDSVTYAGPNAKKGWYVDLPNSRKGGERAAASPVSIADAVLFASLMPGAGGRLYILDALTGFSHTPAVTGARAPVDTALPLVFVETAPEKGAREPTGRVTTTRRVTLYAPHAVAGAPAPTIEVRTPAGRLGWREVANWPELHQAATGR